MTYNEIRQARAEAQNDINRADMAIRDAAQLIANRLKVASVDCNTLYQLKHELKNFNMKTYCWKESK